VAGPWARLARARSELWSNKAAVAGAGELAGGGNNREISTPQDVRNSVMALFWPVWELYWGLY
jgi:hypothetical protein